MALDQFDRKILHRVQKDARLPSEVIANDIGLSVSAVQRRLKKLREQKVILRDVALLNPDYAVPGMSFWAGIEIERDNYYTVGQFKKWAEDKTQIRQTHYVTGQVDLMVLITAHTVKEYDQLIENMMQAVPNIRRVTTNVVLESSLSYPYLPILQE